MSIPQAYQWLLNEPGPKILVEALKLYGVTEKAGDGNNPVIMGWATECGIKYDADSVPWCGLFAAVIVKRSGKPPCKSPLWARSWSDWGSVSPAPMLGDILVFSRQSGGHVGVYVGEDTACYHVLGGNQGDQVSIVRILKSRLIAARHHYAIGAPANVRRVFLAPGGHISSNEQ